MSFDPFEQRLQELGTQEPPSGQQQPLDPFEQRLQENQSEMDPFEARLKGRKSFSQKFWDGLMDLTFSPEETAFEQGLGQSIRGIATQLGGLPGDLSSLATGASQWLNETIPTPEIAKKEPNFVQNMGKKVLESLPTSESLQKKYDQLTDSQYEPKSDREALLQEIGGDAATFLLGAGTWTQALKALGVAAGSNLAKEGMKELGFNEGTQNATKIGTMFTLSMFNPRGARNYVRGLYRDAEAVLPRQASVSSVGLETRLNRLETDLSRGIRTVESKRPVLQGIEEVRRNINQGRVEIRNLTEAKRNLNEARTAKIYDPEFRGTRKVRRELRSNYSRLSRALDDSIYDYGTQNPEFTRLYRDAQRGWAGLEQSTRASNFFSRNLKRMKFQSSLASLIPTYFFPGQTIALGATGFAGLKSYEFMHRIMLNPILRRHYMNAAIAATRESAPAMIKSLKKLDEAALKEEKKQ